MEEDVLKDELNELTETQVMLEQVPIMIPLLENRVSWHSGKAEGCDRFYQYAGPAAYDPFQL